MYNESIYEHILFMILYTLSISTIYQSKIDLNTCIYIYDLLKHELKTCYFELQCKSMRGMFNKYTKDIISVYIRL